MTEDQKMDWRLTYLSDELREFSKRLEEAEKQLKQAESEVASYKWSRDKLKAITEMLEKAYNVHFEAYKVTSCAQTGKEEKKQ